MCTLPPSECLSTGAEATESEICVAPLNVEKTSAPACLVRDGYRVRAVGSPRVSGLHIGRSTQILRVAEGIYAFARGRTGEGEQDGDDDESGGKPAGRWRRTPASGGTGGTLRHLSRRRVTEVATGESLRGSCFFMSPLGTPDDQHGNPVELTCELKGVSQ